MAFVCSHNQVEVILQSSFNMEYIRKWVAGGYILIFLLIGIIVYVWSYEWHKVEHLELENQKMNAFRQEIHHANICTMELSLMGETMLEWEDEDVQAYHRKRLEVDSLLCRFKQSYPAERIDTMRNLLESKEQHLYQIMQLLNDQEAINEEIAERVPVIAWKSVQENPKKAKRKGLFGIFGKKEKPEQTATTTMLYTLNRDMIARQKAQSRRLSEHVDSLAARNAELNRQLQTLIGQMDEIVQTDLLRRETEITSMRERSFLQIGGLTGFILLLLIVSYIIINRYAKRISKYKKETTSLIGQIRESNHKNEELIISRKKAMHTITHELRTPLTAIHGYTELIQCNGIAENKRHAERILQASKRMIAMLNSLLDFFRLDSGKEKPICNPFRLQDICDTMEAEFRPMAENKDLKLIVGNDADVILMGDKERILQIGDNLLSNAIKYTQAGNVSFRSGYDGKTLTLIVEDTGSGMSAEEQQRVFGAFERLSNAVTQDGFGLGLSIVKHIVDMLGGIIRIESEKGRGSRFTVEIPVYVADVESEDNNHEAMKPDVEKSYSVIALDDNEIVLSMIKEMYAGEGVHCDTFGNISDVMEAMRTRRYDLLITDMKMPETNGYEVLELLRSSDIGNSKTIPVIVVTASGSCTEEELTVQGFSACLFKPFDMAELMAVSEKCVKQDRITDNLPDFSSLLAYGDKAAMLQRLITETEKDMQIIRYAEEKNDRKALDGQVHRLRSSWTVIRADRPLWELYEALHGEKECTGEELRYAVDGVLRMGTLITELAKEKERRLADENICD